MGNLGPNIHLFRYQIQLVKDKYWIIGSTKLLISNSFHYYSCKSNLGEL